jgi:Asp-tRNA(Asn)/Glu-tRNA(Gln) amidotransferase A subunit family amidase
METFQSISELSLQLKLGQRTARDICADAIDAARSSRFGAFSDIIGEAALAEAEASDLRRRRRQGLGSLDGVPIAVKDLIDTTPAICKAGLEHLASYRPTADAAVVQRLRKAGAVIIGVTETDPGAFSTDTPQVINPLAPSRIAGGSSGGSAAAVAAGIVPGAIGTDTGGSIRIPAACCSIYGFKPTWGRVDDDGVRPLARSLDHVGPMATNIADLCLLQSVLEGGKSRMLHSATFSSVRLGTSQPYFADADAAVSSATKHVFKRLIGAGATIAESQLPSPDEVLAFHMVNLPKEAADYHDTLFQQEWRSYPDIARDTVSLGKNVSDHDFEAAERRRRRCRDAVDAALSEVDAIILPTMPVDAPLRAANTVILGDRSVTKLEATIRYTALFNQTGHPVVSMPAYLMPDGRALSVQLVGRRGEDNALLSLALYLEKILALEINYAAIIAAQNSVAYAAGRATT